MVTIKLEKPWTYRDPQTTIDYPAGEHSVFAYIADAAEKAGVIEDRKERDDGSAGKPPATGKKGAADTGKG